MYTLTYSAQTVSLRMHPEQVVGLQILARILSKDLHIEPMQTSDHSRYLLGSTHVPLDRFVQSYPLEMPRYVYAIGSELVGSFEKEGYLLDGMRKGAELFQVNWLDYVHQIYDVEREKYIPVAAI